MFAKKFTNNADDDGIGVSVDASDNIILTGKFQGSIDMGGGSVASAGATDMYLAKFDSAGTHTWSDTFGGAFPDFTSGVYEWITRETSICLDRLPKSSTWEAAT